MKRNSSMSRTQVINYLIEQYKYKSYLEIGCQNDVNFNGVKCDIKVGVDPERGGTHRMTSDEFFEKFQPGTVYMTEKGPITFETFDIIFIDGLHHAEQVYEDITNSLEVLNEGGIIICHDMIPSSYEAQLVPRQTKNWNGDCWKAFVKLRTERGDLQMHTIQTDCGLGIIKKFPIVNNGGLEMVSITQYLTIVQEINYENFVANQKEWLNAIEVEEFLKLY